MGYRANYSLHNKKKLVVHHINKACFSGLSHNIKTCDVLKLYILQEYSDKDNNLIFTEDDIRYLVKDLKNIGFRFNYLGLQPVKNYFHPSDLTVKSLYKSEDEVIDLIHVFKFNIKKHYSENVYSLLFVLSIIRYLYEVNNQKILIKYFKLRKHKSEAIRRFGIIRLLFLAHYLVYPSLYFGGHNVGIIATYNHLVNKKEFLNNIKNKPLSAQKMFLGKQRKRSIMLDRRRDLINKDIKEIYNLIK